MNQPSSPATYSFPVPGFEALDLVALQQIPGIDGARDTTFRFTTGGRGDPQLSIRLRSGRSLSIMRDPMFPGQFELAVFEVSPGRPDTLYEHLSPTDLLTRVRAAADQEK